nr:hypothetical protein [Massilia sp. PDC64]
MLSKRQRGIAEEILRRLRVRLRPGAIPAIGKRGALEIANRQTANCPRVFKHAIRCGLAERNPAEFLREVLQWSCRPASR